MASTGSVLPFSRTPTIITAKLNGKKFTCLGLLSEAVIPWSMVS